MHGSRLYYWRTSDEVRLGDRVRMTRWLRKPVLGTVCYIPGISPKHAELEDSAIKQWAIRSDDGAVFPILYDPERFQPPKRIQLVERGPEEVGLLPEERLDEYLEQEEAES